MTERNAPAVQHGLLSNPLHTEVTSASLRTGEDGTRGDDATAHGACGQAPQPLTLAAVLRHVVALERQSGAPLERGDLSFSTGVSWVQEGQEVQDESTSDAALVKPGEPALRRLNGRLAAALEICFQLNTARLQLQNAISAQRELETVLEMLAARVEAGQASQAERRQLSVLLASERDKVSEAGNEWYRIGRRFTLHTRLLPAQLDTVIDTLGTLPADEMDRLAEACLWTHADVHFSLRQRVSVWADRHAGPQFDRGLAPEDFHAWILRMEQARTQAAADFSAARECYLQAVLDLDREHAGFVRARSLRRSAETAFRFGPGRALTFAGALVEERARLHAVLALQTRRSTAKHRLFELAGLLPQQFGLVDHLAWH